MGQAQKPNAKIPESTEEKSMENSAASISIEFVPVDEDQLYVDSYWWAQPNDIHADDVPWSTSKSLLASNDNNQQQDASINESKVVDEDPFENHPFFKMNISRLTKPQG